jgi:hypothetical protein
MVSLMGALVRAWAQRRENVTMVAAGDDLMTAKALSGLVPLDH